MIGDSDWAIGDWQLAITIGNQQLAISDCDPDSSSYHDAGGGPGVVDSMVAAFELLRSTVDRLQAKGSVSLSGLKSQLRKRQPDFTEKRFGFSSFLQFCKAPQTRGLIEMTPHADSGAYAVRAP